jgi:hypothetical protein
VRRLHYCKNLTSHSFCAPCAVCGAHAPCLRGFCLSFSTSSEVADLSCLSTHLPTVNSTICRHHSQTASPPLSPKTSATHTTENTASCCVFCFQKGEQEQIDSTIPHQRLMTPHTLQAFSERARVILGKKNVDEELIFCVPKSRANRGTAGFYFISSGSALL